MEIISIPLKGKLKHGDSMGNGGTIVKGQVQVMSAGTGVVHSEMNGDSTKEVKFLQIWVIPKEMGVEPRYDELNIADNAKPNDLQQIVSPNKDDDGVWIHQNAWFFWSNFDKGIKKTFHLKNDDDGVYVFVLNGKLKIGDQILEQRDGLGIEEVDSFDIEAEDDTEFLLMEVPMMSL